jgi:hypothetical protein
VREQQSLFNANEVLIAGKTEKFELAGRDGDRESDSLKR